MGSGQPPAGGIRRPVKAGMAETGAANINTRSGPQHKGCRGHNAIHSHLEQGAARPLPLLSATDRGASLQRPLLPQRGVQVLAAPKFLGLRDGKKKTRDPLRLLGQADGPWPAADPLAYAHAAVSSLSK